MSLPAGIIQTPEGHYVLAKDSHLSRWIEGHKRLDVAADQIAHYAKHIPLGGTVLDAGACLGDHTATYAKLVGDKGRVIALEPNPLTFEALRLNFLNSPVVQTRNVGLGGFEGPRRMRQDDNAGASFIALDGEIEVMLTTIDALDLERLDFVHLDLEGYETGVLCGGEKTIERLRPVIVFEVHHEALKRCNSSEHELRAILRAMRYDVREIEPHHGPHLPCRDVIALPL